MNALISSRGGSESDQGRLAMVSIVKLWHLEKRLFKTLGRVRGQKVHRFTMTASQHRFNHRHPSILRYKFDQVVNSPTATSTFWIVH